MKILKQTSDDVFILDNPKAPRFKRIEAAFGWMEAGAKEARKSIHCLMVGGEQEDGRLAVMEEWIGKLLDVTRHAVDAKDRLWLPRIWVDAREKGFIHQLRRESWADGLTRYEEIGKDHAGRRVYKEKDPEKRWPNFRSFDDTASLVPVPDHVTVDLTAGLGRIFALTQSKELVIHGSCSELLWCIEQKTPTEILDHPVVQATIALVWALDIKRNTYGKPVKSDVAYGNLRK